MLGDFFSILCLTEHRKMLLFQHIKFGSRIFIILCVAATIAFYIYSNTKTPSKTLKTQEQNDKFSSHFSSSIKSLNTTNILQSVVDRVYRFGIDNSEVKIAVVLCGEQLNKTIVTLKSAILLTTVHLHYIIIADEENRLVMKDQLLSWPQGILKRLSFEIHPITFPNGNEGDEWRKLFKLCACQRLFLTSLLQHIDSLIYVDTDVIFMHPVEKLWSHFDKMNNSHIAGLAPEHEDFATGWYNRFARHPYYEPLGVNSGVMLMNLTRMRAFEWETYLQPLMKEYKLKIVWGDQDIINIIFHFHPEKLYIFSCDWNFRPDHCMYSSVCKSAEENGVKIVHGSRGVYQNNKQPVFKAIYDAVANYQLGSDVFSNLLKPMKKYMAGTLDTNCGKLYLMLTKSLENFISPNETKLYR